MDWDSDFSQLRGGTIFEFFKCSELCRVVRIQYPSSDKTYSEISKSQNLMENLKEVTLLLACLETQDRFSLDWDSDFSELRGGTIFEFCEKFKML